MRQAQINGKAGNFGVMITNNAADHPQYKYAQMIARRLIIDPPPQNDPDKSKSEAAENLRRRFIEKLETAIQRLHSADFNGISAIADSANAEFQELAAGTVLGQHFSRAEISKVFRAELAAELTSLHYLKGR